MATPTPKDTADVGRLEHEIAQVRGDLGRTVQEIGTRLTPAHLMEEARRSLKQGTVETTKAVAQSATDVASDVASRSLATWRSTHATTCRRIHTPPARPAPASGWATGWSARRCVDASVSCRVSRMSRRSVEPPGDVEPQGHVERVSTSRLIPLGAAAAAAWLIWRSRA